MAKIFSVIAGIISIISSIVLACFWWTAFKYGLQFLLIAILFFCGLIFFLAGVAEIKDLAKAKREENSSGASS
ncbi:MAG: hypothetical protein ABIB11_01905 [Candidatus Omnitrophota bacterium]